MAHSARYAQLSQREDDLDDESHGAGFKLAANTVMNSRGVSDEEQHLEHVRERENSLSAAQQERRHQLIALRNDRPVIISRAPSSPRDALFGLVFVMTVLSIVLFSFVEQRSLSHSTSAYEHAGSWSSIIMIVTVMGSALGSIVSIVLLNADDNAATILQFSLSASLILKILLGNALLIMRSKYSLIGVVVLLTALWDSLRYRQARESLTFTATLMSLTRKVFLVYGMSLSLFLASIIFFHTCGLLWWGAFFAGLVGTVHSSLVVVVSLAMMVVLYAISEFCQSVVSFVVGGCALWLFLREAPSLSTYSSSSSAQSQYSLSTSTSTTQNFHTSDSSLDAELYCPLERPTSKEERSKLSQQVLLYLQCAFTASFGSLCKAAMVVPLVTIVNQLRYTIVSRHHHAMHAASTWLQCLCLSRSCVQQCCGSSHVTLHRGMWKHSTLSFPLLAVFGRTLSRTSDDQCLCYPESLLVLLDDTTSFVVQSITTCVASVIAVLFALFADEKEGETWPLFLIVCFFVCARGFSIAMGLFASCVDAFIVAAAMKPDRLAKENQLVLLRFMRTAELELQ